MIAASTGPEEAAERAFFQEEFRKTTLVLSVRADELGCVTPVVRDLVAGECRVLVVVGTTPGTSGRVVAKDVAALLRSDVSDWPDNADSLAVVWTHLADDGMAVVEVDAPLAMAAARLAGRLGVPKLVLTEPEGGWGRSFASIEDLDVASPREGVVAAVRWALEAGVGAVNVCRVEDLDAELFTFDGAGTLFTDGAYVQIDPLRVDDLPVVEQLVARGVAEGFLRERPRREVVRLALGGLGARVGPHRHLAGFGGLEVDRYRAAGVAEVACLYTINRYVGEGVGGRLVAGLVEAARDAQMRGVFACTVSDRAGDLFHRCGFRSVPADRLPAEKWVDYDPDRRSRLTAHWYDLAPGDDT